VTTQDAERIEAARAQKTAAEHHWRQTVLDVAARSSVRAAAKEAGISPDTITQWKKQAN
jgi:transposase